MFSLVRWLPQRVGTRLLAVVIFAIGASLALALLAAWLVYRDAQNASRVLARQAAENLVVQVAAQFGEDDDLDPPRPFERYNLQRTVDYAHQAKGRDIRVFNLRQQIVVDTDHEDIGVPVPAGWQRYISAATQEGSPVFFEECIEAGGDVRQIFVTPLRNRAGRLVGGLAMDYTHLADELTGTARNTLLILSVAGAFALVLTVLFGQAIVRPIALAVRRLYGATRALAAGLPLRPVALGGHDEFAELGRAFDDMSAQLGRSRTVLEQEVAERRAAQVALQEANVRLEERVAERTAALQSANRQLEIELANGKEMARQMEQLARFDSLTGLPNRAMFLACLDVAVKRAIRMKTLGALMFIDLDRFKSINDSLGHATGDEVLRQAAQRLAATLRSCDMVSRIGGDEFTVILEDLGGENAARAVAGKIVAAFLPPFNIEGKELFLSSSVGLALFPKDSADPGDLMKQADFAMYEAKSAGRNRFALHSEHMAQAASQRLVMESALHHAIERSEFYLAYQIRVSALDGTPTGTEALLRWRSPELGEVTPVEFIPVAEHSGQILEIGLWVLRQACRQHSAWRAQGLQPGLMAVNISAVQFRQAGFVDQVAAILDETGMKPHELELELTESMLMANPESAVMVMHALRELGVGLAIDDFGTGYSSLSYLKRFPASRIKIDKSFVRDIDINQEDAAIAAAIVALARSLNIEVTAEGVETDEQLAHLNRLDCADYQGYYFAQPLAAEDIRFALTATLVVQPG
ncbi:putative bifunctional diguanylate cyclase/phosphodiesterase [Silvimonas iriomotensis]|uniref:Diguanylate cyclase (GGDEF) domain-containing protein n=1 Tax=Silvimonas iriomotensis TaxID=449662 RepID=A0ABQ2PBT6_9NEIS|nr:EAL domain-containing protein [Silvimonas iriomotensis]GGP22679.1 hypothetical protein GCM10010970_26790 [Silvimonas iriomotensis]